MSVYKRGVHWWYSFWFEGQHIQQGTKVTSRKLASKMEAIHKAQLALGKYGLGPVKAVPRFADFADHYLDYSKANKPAYGVERYYVPKALVPFFGKFRLNEIGAKLVENYKQQRLGEGLKKSSINREVGLLKSMLSTAVKWGDVDKNGTREAKLFKLDEPPSDRVLSFEEEEKLLAACEGPELRGRAPHLKAIILVALYTGLRRGEILRLRWADIDFDNNLLIVRRSKTAAGQGRRVNLNTVLRELLWTLRQKAESEWIFPSPDRFQEPDKAAKHIRDIKHAFGQALKLAGVTPITFHQLRHTFCTRLANAGVPLPVIQDLAGHASILMTRRYTHPGNELKQKAVELLLAGRNGAETATKSATPVEMQPERRATEKGQVVQFRRLAKGAKREEVAQTST